MNIKKFKKKLKFVITVDKFITGKPLAESPISIGEGEIRKLNQ